MIPLISVIKTLESRPLDRDPTIAMLPASFNRGLYNACI